MHVAFRISIGPLTASGALLLADVLALESGLSFHRVGRTSAPGASWGNMVQDALAVSRLRVVDSRGAMCVFLVVTVLSAAARLPDHLQKKELARAETGVPGQ